MAVSEYNVRSTPLCIDYKSTHQSVWLLQSIPSSPLDIEWLFQMDAFQDINPRTLIEKHFIRPLYTRCVCVCCMRTENLMEQNH